MFGCRWINQRSCGRNGSMRRKPSHCHWQALPIQARQSLTLKTSISMTFPAQTMSPTHRYSHVQWQIHESRFVFFWLNTLLFRQLFSGSSEVEEENDPDGVFGLRRRTGCQYHAVRCEPSWYAWIRVCCSLGYMLLVNYSVFFSKARSGPVGGRPWSDPAEGGVADVRYRYSLTTLTVPRRCLGLARRRVGRGGRWVKPLKLSKSSSFEDFAQQIIANNNHITTCDLIRPFIAYLDFLGVIHLYIIICR